MQSLESFFQEIFSKFIGILIVFSILSMVLFSIESSYISPRTFEIILFSSLTIFLLELILRITLEKRVSLLTAIDALVLVNGFFIGILDLRVLRIFRLFEIFNRSKFLLPTNTLMKTIFVQRNALLGSRDPSSALRWTNIVFMSVLVGRRNFDRLNISNNLNILSTLRSSMPIKNPFTKTNASIAVNRDTLFSRVILSINSSKKIVRDENKIISKVLGDM